MKFVPVPCKCGKIHNEKDASWTWSYRKPDVIEEAMCRVKRCRKCRQILLEQGVEFTENPLSQSQPPL